MPIQNLLELVNGGVGRPSLLPGARLTEELWNAAHAVHAGRAQLHDISAHGCGVVTGLQVTATEPGSRYVSIHPGVAVDARGQLVVVTDNPRDQALRRFKVDVGRGWIYILLEYRSATGNTPPDPSNSYLQLEEYAYCEATTQPPRPHQIELARIRITDEKEPIRAAADPARPKPHEIDLRFRTVMGSGVRGEIVIGQLVPLKLPGWKQWDQYFAGISLLTRHLQSDGPFQARYLPLVRLTGDEQECSLLYLTGSTAPEFAPEQTERLRSFINGGGVLLAEGTDKTFVARAKTLANELGIRLQALAAPHPLFVAHHVFSTPPPGGPGDQGELSAGTLGAGTLIVSTRDYGSAWEGAGGLDRGRIRDATEFGANVMAYACQSRGDASLQRVSPP